MKISVENIKKAIEIIEGGGVAILPTDTIYGLCCSALNEKAIEKIERIKRRKTEDRRPFPLIAGSMKVVEEYFEVPEEAEPLILKFWPGPLSILMKPRWEAHPAVCENGKSALRIPARESLLILLKTLRIPVVATSANITSHPPARTIDEIPEEIRKEVDVIMDAGPSPSLLPSTIYDVESGRILREGRISIEEIKKALLRER